MSLFFQVCWISHPSHAKTQEKKSPATVRMQNLLYSYFHTQVASQKRHQKGQYPLLSANLNLKKLLWLANFSTYRVLAEN